MDLVILELFVSRKTFDASFPTRLEVCSLFRFFMVISSR